MKNFLLPAALIIVCAALVTSCNQTGASKTADESTTVFDTTAAKKAVIAGNQNLSEGLAKGDSVAAGNCYLEDAKFMLPNAPAVIGRKNIQSKYAGFIKGGVTKLGLTVVNLYCSENILGEEGAYTFATKDGHQIDKGKYVVLWKKDADGNWKILRDCINSDLPVPAK
jgi:ketosteroid isomerase-like protein